MALKVCRDSGFPVAEEKTVGPTTLIPLLGIELDSEWLELRLPPGKLTKLCELVGKWRRRKCCTKRELQSLAGHLNHACKVVRPGWRFLRGVFGLLSQFRRLRRVKDWVQLFCARCLNYPWGGRYRTTNRKPVVFM